VSDRKHLRRCTATHSKGARKNKIFAIRITEAAKLHNKIKLAVKVGKLGYT